MRLNRRQRRTRVRLEYLDVLMDSYLNWRAAARAVSDSYRQWNVAERRERDAAFSRYVAALDREGEAATRYRGVLQRMLPERPIVRPGRILPSARPV